MFVRSFLLALLPALVFGWSQEPVTRRNVVTFIPVASAIPVLLESQNAFAYERRDVGDDSRSAATAAMNEQAYKTNNRLEASGFKLDTREEEQARLSSALSSLSYDGSSQKTKTGYRGSAASKDPKSK